MTITDKEIALIKEKFKGKPEDMMAALPIGFFLAIIKRMEDAERRAFD